MEEKVLSYKIGEIEFEGPMDLLLGLISKNKLNIYDIPLMTLIDEYLAQIDIMKRENMEIASEFLEMASRLLYMKTVSLLPKHEEIEELKRELTGELIEYSICREVAAKFSTMQGGFDRFVRSPEPHEFSKTYELVHSAEILKDAYLAAIGRGKRRLPPSSEPFKRIVAKKIVSVSTKIVFVLRKLISRKPRKLSSLYEDAQSRSDLVATFLAVLELCKKNRVKISGSGKDMDISLIGGKNSGVGKDNT